MNKLSIYIILILVLVPLVSAQQDWLYESTEGEFDINISTNIKINGNVEDLRSNLTLYPREDERQYIINTESDPYGTDHYFYWDKLSNEQIKFKESSKIKTSNKIYEVKESKYPFDIPNEYLQYIDSSGIIDSDNKEVIKLAEELASGEQDTYKIIFDLANWVEQNIKYSLDTVTEKSSKEASWVLENRRGVCDEITNLFIAMSRALGIPARFVSGLVYTSSDQFDTNWGPHGWAEVYIPEYGWIPIDITYGQIGWLDLSHIKLKDSLDPSESSVIYKWNGDKITPDEIKFDVNAKNIGDTFKPNIKIKANIQEDKVGLGSYNSVEVILENVEDFYQVIEIRLIVTESMNIEGNYKRLVLLGPNERKKEYFIVKVKDDLSEKYEYTIPVKIKTLWDESSSNFVAVAGEKILSYDDVDFSYEFEKSKDWDDVNLECKIYDNEIYVYEKLNVECDIKYLGNEKIDAKFCLFECENIELENKIIKKQFVPKRLGRQDIKAYVQNGDFVKVDILPITVLDRPNINYDINYGKQIRFNEDKNIELVFEDNVLDESRIDIFINNKKVSTKEIKNLENNKLILTISGSNLMDGANEIKLVFKFKDQNKKNYVQEDSIYIELVDTNILQKIFIFFIQLFNWMLLSKTLLGINHLIHCTI